MYRYKSYFTMWWIVFFSFFATACFPISNENQNNYETTEEDTINSHLDMQEITNTEEIENDRSETVRRRIESIRKRHELRDMFISAEAYLEWWQQALWLRTLLDVYRENPEDWIVVTKIAETYYEMKRFWSALNYYMRLPTLNERQKQRVLLLHFYTQDITTDEWRNNILTSLDEIGVSEQDFEYYRLSLNCIQDNSWCLEWFQTYISTLEEITSSKLNNMRLAIRNYLSFWLDEDYLLNTYIITQWYRDDLYPLVIELWSHVMDTRETYKPVIKLVWHSLFELWLYEDSKDILTRFHRLDDSDPWVNYMLWIIYAKTRDSVLANIFLRRALDLWYTPTLNLRRHIAYNFALIESRHNLLSALKDLIQLEEDYEKTDLSLAIYYHILYESYETAIEFAQLWQEKYSDDAYFYWYEGWAHRELWNPENSIKVLQEWLTIIPDNPFLYLQLAFALKEAWNEQSMKMILDRLLALDISSEYRQIAQRERLLLSP